jgi:hypothetical protein
VPVGVEPLRQGRQVWGDKGYGLRGEAAERTLIAAMAGRCVLRLGFIVVDLDAELGRVAKDRLELGGDRRVIGAREGRRGKPRRRRSGEKLDDERERDEERGQSRAGLTRAPLRGRASVVIPRLRLTNTSSEAFIR